MNEIMNKKFCLGAFLPMLLLIYCQSCVVSAFVSVKFRSTSWMLSHKKCHSHVSELDYGRMARGDHGLPKVLLGPAMPYPSMPCRRATPETALWLYGPFRDDPPYTGGLRSSSSPLDTPCRTPMLLCEWAWLTFEKSESNGHFLKSSEIEVNPSVLNF